MTRPSVWVAVGLLVAASTTGALAGPGVDVQINSDAPGTVQNEIRITQNPTNSSNLVVAYNDGAGGSSTPLGVSHSLDTGASWTDTQLSVPLHPLLGTPLSVIFDPYIDADSQGNVYAGYIATDGSLGGASGNYIESSQNGGMTWSGPTQIDFNAAASGPVDPAYRFNDRPDMTVDAADNTYVVWIKDVGVGLPTSDIYFAKSPPFPLDFTGGSPGSVAPQTVNDFPNGTDRANVPDVAVAPDGTVYIAWIDVDVTNPSPKTGTLLIDKSLNGGVSFGPDVTVQTITALANHLSTSSGTADDARSGSYPAIAVDPGNSLTVYLVYAADPTGSDEADIFFLKSTNGGVTWSGPNRLNDDATTNDQFHPAIAVKPNGTIDVVWYDKRNSATDSAWDVYFAKSTNGGASFSPNVRITDQSFATPTDASGTQPWLGEYLGLEVDATNAYVAFTSGISDSKGDVFFDLQPNVSPPPVSQCDIEGTSGDDNLVGNSGNNVICGFEGDDTLDGGGGNDVLIGGAGDDVLAGGPGDDQLVGESGSDTGDYKATPNAIIADLGAGTVQDASTDTLSGVEHITGSNFGDTIVGDANPNNIRGRRGLDTIRGAGGPDTLLGGRGRDTVVGGQAADIVKGGRGADLLRGGRGADILRGGLGDDVIRGGRGADRLFGNVGDDDLNGGDGSDGCSGGAGTDVIRNCET